MHELAITQSILHIALEAAGAHGAQRIREIRIRMGDYCGVVPQCVQYYFDVLSRDTAAAGAELNFLRLPIRMRCRGCGWEGEVDKRHIQCAACGGTDLALLQGREFYVESLEAEDPPGKETEHDGN